MSCPVAFERRLRVALAGLFAGSAVSARLMLPMAELGPHAPWQGLAVRLLPCGAGLLVGALAAGALPRSAGCRAPTERRGVVFLAGWPPFTVVGASAILDIRTSFVRAVGGGRNASGTFETIAIALALVPIALVIARRFAGSPSPSGVCGVSHYRAPMSLELWGVALLLAAGAAGPLALSWAETPDQRLAARVAFYLAFAVAAGLGEALRGARKTAAPPA